MRKLFSIAIALYLLTLVVFAAIVIDTAYTASLYVQDKPALRYLGLPSPPSCGHLYNVNRSQEWAACVGVPYK